MKIKIALFTVVIVMVTSNISAQEVKFGKVTKKELEEKFYSNDTSANAVVLFKKRRTYYEYNNSIGWELITEVHERLKLYNKDGFENATKKLRLFDQGGDQESVSIKAYTYNLKGGKIEKTKLEKKGVFNEKVTNNWNRKNFTMPNLKDGSIVEWKYKITSPFYSNIDNVICQYKIPIKTLDVKIQIPDFFTFKYLPSRYYPMKVIESKIQKNYSITSKSREGSAYKVTKTKVEYDNVKIMEKIYAIKSENIPALVEEPFVNNIYNYQSRVDFEISAYTPTGGTHKYYNTTWEDVTKTIYESQYFGEQLNKKNYFKNDLENITNDISIPSEKVVTIFQFVKNKIKWNKEYSKYTSIKGVKEAYKSGVGNVAEINLTLISMLREAGISANPILVSTRNHGIPIFPTKDGYNYVIAGIESGNKIILLDATEKYSIPNVLPFRDLNWEGRLIREDGTSTTVDLYPKNYNTKDLKLKAKIDSEGSVSGLLNSNLNHLSALNYRIENNALSEDELISKIEEKNNGIEVEKIRVTNKNNIDKPIIEVIQFSKDNQADIIDEKMYFSPLLFLTVNENPFKLEERTYPIDYGSIWKYNIRASIEIPEGFVIESKPEDLKIILPNNIGTFILQIKTEGNLIKVLSQTKMNTAIIGANHYRALKEFYSKTIEREQEKIVLTLSQP
ncbi:MAG: transglutaminase domain-containing protein [Bacteroidota bacterium]